MIHIQNQFIVLLEKEIHLMVRLQDFKELKKVLNELIMNAIEHGNKKSVEKKIECSVARMHGSLFKITVKDEGEGFDYRRSGILTPAGSGKQGYTLVRALCEQIDFNRKGNRVMVYIKMLEKTVFDISYEEGWKIIRPSGNITSSTADKLQELLLELVESGHTKYRFDFDKVEDIDSVSITRFIVLAKMLSKQGLEAELEIVNSNDNLANLFGMIRLDKHYHIKSG